MGSEQYLDRANSGVAKLDGGLQRAGYSLLHETAGEDLTGFPGYMNMILVRKTSHHTSPSLEIASCYRH